MVAGRLQAHADQAREFVEERLQQKGAAALPARLAGGRENVFSESEMTMRELYESEKVNPDSCH